MISVQIANEQSYVSLSNERLDQAVRIVMERESVTHARISLAMVDDETIRRLHREYLHEDEATDVLSFLLEGGDRLEGEVVASGETANRSAGRFGWSPQEELLLYVIHGTLHLVGYRDYTVEEQTEMRAQERACLARLGIEARYEDSNVTPESGAVPKGASKVR